MVMVKYAQRSGAVGSPRHGRATAQASCRGKAWLTVRWRGRPVARCTWGAAVRLCWEGTRFMPLYGILCVRQRRPCAVMWFHGM